MDDMEYIDDYFNGSPTEQQKQQFEQRIINEISFAEEVAFYISAHGLIKEQTQSDKKKRFREIYEQQKTAAPVVKMPVGKIARYIAAAASVAAIFLLVMFFSRDNKSAQQLADQYIKENFQHLNVTMGKQDSLQMAISAFNDGKLPEALDQFKTILKNDATNNDAKKYAGIAYLRTEKYDSALAYFSLLAADTSLFSNYGKFYQAISLLKRNNPGDKETARSLLIDVRDGEKTEGAAEAKKWLKKLDN